MPAATPLPPIPFVTGAGPAGAPLPLRQRLMYMRDCLDARVVTPTVFAVVPSPRTRVSTTRMRGLSARLLGSEVRLASERECYAKIRTMVEVLHIIMRAPGFNSWYIVNSLLMRQCAYLSLYFILGNEEYEQFQANIAMIWVRFDTPGRYVAAVLSRQVGKTAVLAAYLALMLSLGRSDDAVAGVGLYAQGAGLSESTLGETTNLMRFVYDTIRADPARRHIVLNTVQSTSISKITMEMPVQWNKQVFCATAKPGHVNNVRGSHNAAFLVDEASFVKRDMMERHFIPMMLETRSGVFMTTPSTSSEPGGDMMQEWIDNPKENFRQGTAEQLSLVCPACYALPTATQCRHNLSYVPPWKEISNLLHSIETAKSSLKRENLERELLGYSQRRTGAVFPYETIRQICTTSDVEIRLELMQHRVIYVAVDPTVGSRSDLAIMCFVIYQNRFVCIGAENVSMKNCGGEEANVVVRSLFIALREQFPDLIKGCAVCPLVESNGSPSTVTDLFRNLQTETFPVTLKLYEHGLLQQSLRGGVQTSVGGVRTAQPAKEEGVSGLFDLAHNHRIEFSTRMATSRIARFVAGSVRADASLYRTHLDSGEPLPQRAPPPFINIPERAADRETAVVLLMKLLESQLGALIRTDKGDITGKGPSKRENDDFVTALIIAICFVTRIAGSSLPLEAVFRM
jgi:hypothetical protein